MQHLFLSIDKLIRGGFTSRLHLQQGQIPIRLHTLLLSGFILGTVYGVFMGIYRAIRAESPEFQSYLPLIATSAKVPLLFFLTLAITFPSLYVFSALAGSPLYVFPKL